MALVRLAVAVAGITVGVPATALAQPDVPAASVPAECTLDGVRALGTAAIPAAWRPFLPDSVFARLAPAVAADAWTAALDTLRAAVDAHAASGALDGSAAERVRRELDTLQMAFAHATPDPGVRARSAVSADRWTPIGDPNVVAYDLFRGTPNAIRVDEATPAARRRAVCWTALGVARTLSLFNAPGRLAVQRELRRLDALWDTYATRGYSQLPWELALNAATVMRPAARGGSLEPPRTQLVLLHPEVAAGVSGGRYPDWVRTDALSVALGGVLRYNAARTSYRGVSANLVLASDGLVGYGPVVYLSRGVSAGYAYRGRAPAGRRHAAVLSADVYRFLVGVPDLVRRRATGALAAAALAAR